MEITKEMKKVNAIDLEPIIFSLTQREDGPNWSLKKAKEIEKWYRRFLFLCAYHNNIDIIPTKDIDIFWHTHILDTIKYFDDCNQALGFYLHHFPYIGLRDNNDKEKAKKAFANTLDLFHLYFKETPEGITARCGSSCGSRISNCGGRDDGGGDSMHICNYVTRPTTQSGHYL